MPTKLPHISVRMKKIHMEKFRYIAMANGRSMSKEAYMVLIKHIERWEKRHGDIDVDND